jgi:hypothetical protein
VTVVRGFDRSVVVVTTLAAVAAVSGCGGSSSSGAHVKPVRTVTVTSTPTSTPPSATASTTPTTTPSATATSAPVVQVLPAGAFEQFQSPTGNIGCEIDKSGARCDIKVRDWTPPPKPADCPVDYGQGVQIFKNGKGSVVCAGDTALDPKAVKLGYNHAVEVTPVRCTSQPGGMTCENRLTGHGFFLSRSSYRVF